MKHTCSGSARGGGGSGLGDWPRQSVVYWRPSHLHCVWGNLVFSLESRWGSLRGLCASLHCLAVAAPCGVQPARPCVSVCVCVCVSPRTCVRTLLHRAKPGPSLCYGCFHAQGCSVALCCMSAVASSGHSEQQAETCMHCRMSPPGAAPTAAKHSGVAQ